MLATELDLAHILVSSPVRRVSSPVRQVRKAGHAEGLMRHHGIPPFFFLLRRPIDRPCSQKRKEESREGEFRNLTSKKNQAGRQSLRKGRGGG